MREDWIDCKFEDILTLKNGFAFKSEKYSDEGTPIIRISDINDAIVKTISSKKIQDEENYESYLVEFEDILIAMSGATTGKFGIYKEKIKAYQNQRVGNFKPHVEKLTNKKYIYYLLYALRRQIEKDAYGGAQPNISSKKIEAMEITLAPLLEQKAIVAKIEQLFSELDKGIESLKTAQAKLKIYRQAVLKKAFEGELTKAWRGKQIHLPTAEELLEAIKQEREAHYQQQLEEWKKAIKEWKKNCSDDKKPIQPRQQKTLNSLNEKDLRELPELTKYWKWTTIDNLISFEPNAMKAGPFGSSLKKSFYTKTGYKIYGQEQVISGDAFYGDYYVNEDKYKELFSCKVKPNDILISLVGTVGKVLILPENSEAGIINPRLVKIELHKKYYLPKLFKYYFESSFLKSIYKIHSHGATMDIITMGIIQNLPYPICTVEEQHLIVQEIESRLSVCDNIEQTISDALVKAEALRQSILKKAFEGKLLHVKELEAIKSHPEYESAEKLLQRIKLERAK